MESGEPMKANQWIALVLGVVALVMLAKRFGPELTGSAPFKVDKLCVLIVRESADVAKYSRDQLNAINGTAWRSYVKEKGGTFRVADPNDDLSREAPWVSEAMKIERESLPWVLVSNGKTGTGEPLTDSETLLATIKKHGE